MVKPWNPVATFPIASQDNSIIDNDPPKIPKGAGRKIKPHNKSRQGCGNCKFRRVKCDESKPNCKRCTAYGVFCNYDRSLPNLQPLGNGVANVQVKQNSSSQSSLVISSPSQASSKSTPSENADREDSFQLSEYEQLEVLNRFQARTIFTATAYNSPEAFQEGIIKHAHSNQFLKHAILSITLMQDRCQSSSPDSPPSASEAYHGQQALSLFIQKLSGPKQPRDVDRIWATGAVLAVTSFCQVDARTPDEAWPLKPSSPLDLNWLKISEGKNQFLQKTQPSEPGDAVESLLGPEDVSILLRQSPVQGLDVLPSELIALCGLGFGLSNVENNPYHAPASSLAQALESDSKQIIILNFTAFMMNMPRDFRTLLEQKDPRALLLLAYWYAKICQYPHWWMSRRAKLECQAICIYLKSFHWEDNAIQNLLQYPRIMAGAVTPQYGDRTAMDDGLQDHVNGGPTFVVPKPKPNS